MAEFRRRVVPNQAPGQDLRNRGRIAGLARLLHRAVSVATAESAAPDRSQLLRRGAPSPGQSQRLQPGAVSPQLGRHLHGGVGISRAESASPAWRGFSRTESASPPHSGLSAARSTSPRRSRRLQNGVSFSALAPGLQDGVSVSSLERLLRGSVSVAKAESASPRQSQRPRPRFWRTGVLQYAALGRGDILASSRHNKGNQPPRIGLGPTKEPVQPPPFKIRVFVDGLRAGLNPDKMSQLLAELESAEFVRKNLAD